MYARIIADSGNPQNQFPLNLTDAESYPSWLDQTGIVGYLRTSPNQSGEQRTGNYQRAAIEQFASERGLTIAGIYEGIGCYGRSIGPATTPQLIAAIEQARRTGFPIVAFDWQRFCRAPHKLARYGVDFVSIVPLSTAPELLPGIRKRAANQYNRAGRGGRPSFRSIPALTIIVDSLGQSWRSIAGELNAQEIPTQTGAAWNHKQVIATLRPYFTYRADF